MLGSDIRSLTNVKSWVYIANAADSYEEVRDVRLARELLSCPRPLPQVGLHVTGLTLYQ